MPTANRKLSVVSTPDYASKYQIIFDQASDAIVTILPDFSIDAVNQAAEEMTGYVRSELVSNSIRLLIPDPASAHIPERTRKLSTDFFKAAGTYEDIAIVRNDGYVRLVDLNVRLVESGTSTLVLAIFRDVTEKKRMERELINKHTELRDAYFELEKKNAELHAMQDTLVQAGKMAALGELAAGIAHELNQPLQGIRGYAQELQSLVIPVVEKLPMDAEVQSGFKEIISNVDKMAQIIQHLRVFTRKTLENFELIDVQSPIEEALKMLSRQFASRGIKVIREYGEGVPMVYANPLQLEQVFINLASNARDAIEATERGSGTIHISTRKVENFTEIVFRDDGAGMSERTKTKVFNPFFTTKEVGKGMGLGLSLSYGMVSKLHGSIVVESEIGKGTTFIIRLPRDFRELG